MANVNDKAFDTMTAVTDKTEVDIGQLGKYSDYDIKVRDIRKNMKLEWEELDDEGRTWTGESSHKMTHYQRDGKWVAHPTLFPNKKNPSTKKEDWSEMNKDDAYKEALKRGEIFDFGEDEESATKFGEGSWKLPKLLQE